MLGKLFKHEFKATGRVQLPIAAAVILLTLVEILLTVITGAVGGGTALHTFLNVLTGILAFFYTLALASYLLAAHFMGIQRFYKNLFTDEGYLTLTLPVKTGALQLVKLMVSLLWALVSIAVAGLCVFGLFNAASGVFLSPGDLWRAFRSLDSAMNPYWMFLLLALTLIASEILFFTKAYFCIAVGQTFSQKHKVAAALIAYLVIDMVLQIASFLLLIGGGALFGGRLEALFASTASVPFDLVYGILIGSTALSLLISGVLFGLTNYFTHHRLNLE